MTLTAEIPLVASALLLAAVALLRVLPNHRRRWIDGLALALSAAAALLPLVLSPFIPAAKGAGRALWEWSAVGGPTIQASYRLDGIGAVGAAAAAAYTAAALFAATRERERPPLLTALVLGIGHTAIALAVVDDLIASIVLLGVLAALTTAAALLVTPPAAAVRIAAYLALGLQLFVVAALLISRFGGASFHFGEIRPTAISPGIVLTASLGAILFAGLYPFVPWRYRRPAGGAAERETLRGLLAMPAGLGASLVLLRLLGVTRTDLSTLGVPAIDGTVRALIALAIVLAVAGVATWRQVIPGRSIVGGGALLALTALYPGIHWSHLALAVALLTILYGAAASLALPEEWDVVRHDVTLATLWIGFALGTPLALAAALAIVATDGALAIAESIWLPPHRAHIVLVAGAVALTTGLGALALGVADAADPIAGLLALVGIAGVLALHLAHLERRVELAAPPFALDAASAAVAFLATGFAAIVLTPSLSSGVGVTLGRELPGRIANGPTTFAILTGGAVLLVAAARSVRPLLPDLQPFGDRLTRIVGLADPVPAAIAGFFALEWTATHFASGFAFVERRAGVGLATLLIVALLFWSTR